MYVDFKITVWERVRIPDDKEYEIIERIKNCELNDSNDIVNEYPESDFELLYETSEQMYVDDNHGAPTIEIMDDNKNRIWKNADDE